MLIPTIGCEVHCELKTETKLFCSCKNEFGGEANTHCCPVCSGFPGTLPMLNKKAVEYAVKAGLALHCEISKFSKWDRKNYFYPDLPKAWQTSQYDLPLCVGGYVEYELNGEKKRVRLNRIHLEEDAGKLIHDGGVSRVDYNRCGVPLIEIVTEPDMHSAEEVVAFLTELKSVLKYTGVSDVKMQEGSLRCDVNLSVAEEGKLGTRTETKNLNSFRSVARSVQFETRRQIDVIESGGVIEQETRRFDDNAGRGYAMRSKEDAHDYRYFPEPDLLPVVFTDEDIDSIASTIPELRQARIERYKTAYGLPEYDAGVLTEDKDVSDLLDETVKLGIEPKRASNFIMSEVLRLCKSSGGEDFELKITPEYLYEILKMQADDEINNLAAKTLLASVWEDGGTPPRKKAEQLNLLQSNDLGEIKRIFDEVLAANKKQLDDFLSGNDKIRGYFVGQVMRAAGGKANPKIINALLDKLKQ